MQCLVLAAGDGTRMLPLTARTAKPLIKVAGNPYMDHTIEELRSAGIDDVALLVGAHKEEVMFYYAQMDHITTPHFVEQHQRLGTAHAIAQAEDWISGPFLCVNGDVLPEEATLKALMEASSRDPSSVAMACTNVDDPTGYGIVEVDDEDRVTGLVEKPDRPLGNRINAGMYVFPADIFDAIRETPMSPRGEYEITSTFEALMAEGRLRAMEMREPWIEVTYPWDVLQANAHLMQDLEASVEGTVEEGVHMEGQVVVREGARVRSGTYIQGPVIIDKGADVGPNSYLRGSTYIGRNCRVGAAVEVKNTVLMDKSNIPHHNYVGDSVIMEDVNLGAGTKVANLRLDGGNVISVSKGLRVNTGMRKLGAIIGPGVKTGINAVIDVGTVVSEDAFIGPGARVKGFIAPGTKVF
jgi:bifunctional UDP-N-acetylglucosamine pyrophosphorylase/glucosamine-1-phosphate N-acetyltransferase